MFYITYFDVKYTWLIIIKINIIFFFNISINKYLFTKYNSKNLVGYKVWQVHYIWNFNKNIKLIVNTMAIPTCPTFYT